MKGESVVLENFMALFNGLDIRYVYAAIAILVLAGIISIIKKAIRLGITVLILALLLNYGGQYIHKFQQNYNINVKGDVVQLTVGGQTHQISLSGMKRVELFNLGNGYYRITLYYEEDETSQLTVKVPTYMVDVIKSYAITQGIEAVEK